MLKSANALVLLAICSIAHAAPPKLKYDQAKRTISITAGSGTTVFEHIDKGEGPELIGMSDYIRILPPDLQPYRDRGILLLNTVMRSTSGDGRGQCGGGYEMYLHAIDLGRRPPRALGKVLVGSCRKDLYPEGMENGAADFSAYAIEDGRLRIHFLGSSATLSPTYRELEFDQSPDATP
jgi:hypothetical protein